MITEFIEYRGMSYEQASRTAAALIKKCADQDGGSWFSIVERLSYLRMLMKREASKSRF